MAHGDSGAERRGLCCAEVPGRVLRSRQTAANRGICCCLQPATARSTKTGSGIWRHGGCSFHTGTSRAAYRARRQRLCSREPPRRCRVTRRWWPLPAVPRYCRARSRLMLRGASATRRWRSRRGHVLDAAQIEANAICAVVSDADHRSSRTAETAAMMNDLFTDLDPVEQCIRSGDALGHLGAAGALVALAVAAGAARGRAEAGAAGRCCPSRRSRCTGDRALRSRQRRHGGRCLTATRSHATPLVLPL